MSADALSAAEKKLLSQVRKLFNTEDQATLRQGFELLMSLDTPAVAQQLAQGLSVEDSGRIRFSVAAQKKGHLRRQSTRAYVSLSVLRAAGALDAVKVLRLTDRREDLESEDWQTKLDYRIVSNTLGDLAPLRGLKKLQHLSLCQVLQDPQHLDAIAKYRALRSLDLSENHCLTSLAPLAGLGALRTLKASRCSRLSDISALAKLSKLQELELTDCWALTDLSVLAGLPKLKSLNISAGRRSLDLSVLSASTSLASVVAYGVHPSGSLGAIRVEGSGEVINTRTLGKLVHDDTTLEQIYALAQRMGGRLCHSRHDVVIDEHALRTRSISQSYGGYGSAVEINPGTFGASWGLAPYAPSGRCPVFCGLSVVFQGTGWQRSVADWTKRVVKDGGQVLDDPSAGIQLVVLGPRGRRKRIPPHVLVATEEQLLELVPIKVAGPKISSAAKKKLTALRKLLKSADPAVVDQGCALMVEMKDVPEQRAALETLVVDTAVEKGKLVIGAPMTRLARAPQRLVVALTLLRVLGRLDGVEQLSLSGHRSATRLGGLSGLASLRKLTVINCAELMDIAGISSLPNLEELELSKCERLRTLDGVAGLPSLKTLTIDFCQSLRSVDGLRELTSMEVLKLQNCWTLEHISGLGGMTQMRKLSLRGCQRITNIDSLVSMQALTELELKRCRGLQDLNIPFVTGSYDNLLTPPRLDAALASLRDRLR